MAESRKKSAKANEGIKVNNKVKDNDIVKVSDIDYDHIGALPFFRTQWPLLNVMTTEIGASVLLKDTPRRVFRELSLSASASYGSSNSIEYDDNDFRADKIIKDKDVFALGGLSVEVMETPGHTRDSLSYFISCLALSDKSRKYFIILVIPFEVLV